MPDLCEVLQTEIQLPDWATVDEGWMGSVFIIDCTPHYRDRVHPGQHLFYRGDKHAHFLTSQVVCSLKGLVYNVVLAKGHNNDQGTSFV